MPKQVIPSTNTAFHQDSGSAPRRCQTRRQLLALMALTLSAWAGGSLPALAQGNGRLYDPEPPVDSAYVRLILAHAGPSVAVQVDGQERIRKLPAQEASDYLVLKEGPHTLTLIPEGKGGTPLKYPLDVVRGKSLTLAFTQLKSDATPQRFEDRGNSNQLKAQLTAYHLDAGSGALTVSVADSGTKVFSDLAYGRSASLQVNPIEVELSVGDGKATPHKFKVAMNQGATYSLFFVRGEKGKLQARTALNKTERYTGP